MTLEVGHDGNRVTLRGALRRFDELRVISAALFDAIGRRGQRAVTLDFSACEEFTPATMLPLLPVVAGYREVSGATFELVAPEDEGLKRLLIDSNWAHFIDPERYAINEEAGGQVPAQRFGGETEMGAIVAGVMDLLLPRMDVEREALAALEWSMYELMDNVLCHAESPTGGFAQASVDAQSGRVEFVVADGGIGVAESMRIRDHEQALARAIAEGGTRDRAAHAGDGLFGAFRAATLSGGQFEINSGFGLLYGSREGPEEYRTGKRRIRYSGTAVRCEVGVGDAGLLGRALGFGDRAYEPLEESAQRGSGAGEVAPFSIREEAAQDVGSRSGGRRVRELVEERLRVDGEAVLDFGGVAVISSGFADEVLGRLFAAMGPRAFMSRVRVRHANAVIDGLIDRAILRRVRAG